MAEKKASTSFWVRAAPKSWSKYTTKEQASKLRRNKNTNRKEQEHKQRRNKNTNRKEQEHKLRRNKTGLQQVSSLRGRTAPF